MLININYSINKQFFFMKYKVFINYNLYFFKLKSRHLFKFIKIKIQTVNLVLNKLGDNSMIFT